MACLEMDDCRSAEQQILVLDLSIPYLSQNTFLQIEA